MSMFGNIIRLWRIDLNRLLVFYKGIHTQTKYFFIFLFIFFVAVNISCYWIAMVTAFPDLVFGKTFGYYFKVQFPVGILGALFDSLSFYITIFIIQRALETENNNIYIAHLSIDLLIAILATFWVIFVFIVSGWIISFIETLNQPIEIIEHYDHETNIYQRAEGYTDKVNDALRNPTKNIRNIYFGIIMGLSAIIPTLIHLSMFCKSIITQLRIVNLK